MPRAAAILCTLSAALALGAPTSAAGAPQVPLSATQSAYLKLAEQGVAGAEAHWRDRRLHWYDGHLGSRERYPLATIWDIVPLFESIDAIAIAQPTAAHRHAVARFAAGAERYLNRGLRPVPGYSPYPGDSAAGTKTWFDDNGWWGLAFMNAYRATGTRRYLIDAERALRYIARAGWDRSRGGIWWDTSHPYHAGEAIATATLLASLIYQQTHSAAILAEARMFLGWANTGGFSALTGLYVQNEFKTTPIDYIAGPLIYAQAVLCEATASIADCARAERLKRRALGRFGLLLDGAPQYDAVYLQWMLALYAQDHDPALYAMAAENAGAAQAHAADGQGLYLLSWAGEVLPSATAAPGLLRTHAATTSLFAWLAVYPPPG
jgi:hypothetical protein